MTESITRRALWTRMTCRCGGKRFLVGTRLICETCDARSEQLTTKEARDVRKTFPDRFISPKR